MLKRIAKFLAPFGEAAPFEGYYQRLLLDTSAQVAPTADQARSDYRQALHDVHTWLR